MGQGTHRAQRKKTRASFQGRAEGGGKGDPLSDLGGGLPPKVSTGSVVDPFHFNTDPRIRFR